MRVLPDLTAVVPFPTPEPPARRGKPREYDYAEIVRLYHDEKLTIDEVRRRVGCSLGTVRRAIALSGRPPRRSGWKRGRRPGRLSQRYMRHEPHSLAGKPRSLPAVDNDALDKGTTVYPHSVIAPADHPRCLIPGENSRKIGGQVMKGPWKGMPIYTLTLEERATCPTTCRHWASCYGNQMNWAKRFRHGPELERWLPIEVAMLSRAHPAGFVVRLHVLGDFYSPEYVQLWAGLLDEFPSLHVFGFTARIDAADPITRILVDLTARLWPRFAMRFSNAPLEELATVSIEHPVQRPADAVICPQQQGRTDSCGTCGLCWQSRRRIAFLQH